MQSEIRIGDKIRQLRELQQVSVEELAERSGSSPDLIAGLEAGALAPSLSPLMKIARALGVRLGTFLDDEEPASPAIVRAGQSARVMRFAGGGSPATSTLDISSLAAGKQDRHMEPFLVEVHQPRETAPPLSSHEGEEFIYVLHGEVELCYGSQRHQLSAGDSVYYDSVVPHHLHALGDTDATILAVVYAPF